MKNLSLKNIEKACNGTAFNLNEFSDTEVNGAVIDSRKVSDGFLFIAVKGERVDGHTFIEQVFEKGALAVISEIEFPELDRPYIKVDSSLQALKDIAEFYRKNLDIKVVGITGSVGKTTTKEAVASVLSRKYKTLKTQGNLNNEIGLPLTILEIRDEHEAAVIEMGVSDFGEMSRLAAIARPDVCLITNIGTCHLENFIDRDGVLKAKTEVFDYLNENATVILNGDDDKLAEIQIVQNKKPLFFGHLKDFDAFCDNIDVMGFEGTNFDIITPDGNKLNVTIKIPGEYMLCNALAAFLVGKCFNISDEQIKTGIEQLTSVSGRNNRINTKKYTIIDDCYNASPASMKSALDVLSLYEKRKVAVLGDMFELGQNSDELHAEIGRYCTESKTDILICIGLKSYNIYSEADKHNTIKCYYYENVDKAKSDLESLLLEEDMILVKASHGMHLETIVEYLEQAGNR